MLCGCCLSPAPKVIASFAGYGDITGCWYTEPDDWYCAQPKIEEADARKTVGHGYPTNAQTGYDRSKFYHFLRQNGLWPREVGGLELSKLQAFCPINHVSDDYPPTLLYHGTADHDVPFDESKRFAAALEKHGIEHLFLPLTGVDHVAKGAKPEDFDRVVQQTADFMISHLKDD